MSHEQRARRAIEHAARRFGMPAAEVRLSGSARQAVHGGDPVLVALGMPGPVPAGWLRSVASSSRRTDVPLDLRSPLPFPDESVDAFHADHVIEHLGFGVAHTLLRDAHRCLKPGGVLRIATTDAESGPSPAPLVLVSGILPGDSVDRSGTSLPHGEAVRDRVRPVPDREAIAVERGARLVGLDGSAALFLFDRSLLDDALTGLGFATQWVLPGVSDHANLRGVERPGDPSTGFRSMVVEATREVRVGRVRAGLGPARDSARGQPRTDSPILDRVLGVPVRRSRQPGSSPHPVV